MNQWIRIATGAILIGGGIVGIFALVGATDLSIIVNAFSGVAFWVNLISILVGISLFVWSIATGIALMRKSPKSPYWAAIIMLLQIPYIQTSVFIFCFGSGVVLRFSLGGVAILFGGQYQVGIPYGNVSFDVGINFFSLAMFSYLLKVNRLEKKIAKDSQRDRPLSHIAPLGATSASLAIMKPRNIAIIGVVVAVCVTGAVLFYHAMSTSMRAMQWVQVTFPELVRNSEPTIAKYGSLKHFETTTCSEGISYGKVNGNFEILAQCIIKASFEQADVVVLIQLKEKEQSWEIREFTMGIPTISFP